MHDNKKGFNRRGRIFQQNPRYQIQPHRQEKKIPKSSEEEAFYSGIKQNNQHRSHRPRYAHHEETRHLCYSPKSRTHKIKKLREDSSAFSKINRGTKPLPFPCIGITSIAGNRDSNPNMAVGSQPTMCPRECLLSWNVFRIV